MSTENGALERLMKYLAAHLFKGQPTPEQSDRALRAASGHLSKNPPHVLASLELDEPNTQVLASAISPKGKVALLVSQKPGTCRLVTWSRESGLSNKKEEWQFGKDTRPRMFYPEGSDEPAVVISEKRLFWEGMDDLISMDGFLLDGADSGHVHLWTKPDGQKRAAMDGCNGLHVVGTGGGADITTHVFPDRDVVRWVGSLRGDLVMIVSHYGEDDVLRDKAVRWNEIELVAPEGYAIVQESIGFDEHGALQCVAKNDKRAYALWSDGTDSYRVEVPEDGVLCFDAGRIFLVTYVPPSALPRLLLAEFECYHFQHIGDLHICRGGSVENVDAYVVGDTVAILYCVGNRLLYVSQVTSNRNQPGSYMQWFCLEDSAFSHVRFDRFHHGIGYFRNRGTGVLAWGRIPDAHPLTTVEFPLYGAPFDRLTEVEDDRGKAIMSWALTDGTLHIIRYPLPR